MGNNLYEYFNRKRIADPVYGTIGLSDVEERIIDTKLFQRLRNVKQMGLANYVFPGITYSRFSHSIGACYIAGRILDSLRNNSSGVDKHAIQEIRIALLLHDVGHYPFSHTFELALEEIHGKKFKNFKHETIASTLLLKDKEIKRIFRENKINIKRIAELIKRDQRVNGDKLIKLVSSDLDADRIDYLQRTAHHAGLPYGHIDFDYILSQVKFSKKKLCIDIKALGAVEHFLLSRYFDYRQITYHKTVVAFDELLKRILVLLNKKFDSYLKNIKALNLKEINKKIVNLEDWHQFDDANLIHNIKEIIKLGEKNTLNFLAKSLIERKPPALLWKFEVLEKRTSNNEEKIKDFLNSRKKAWSEKYEIDEDFWFVWGKQINLTKIGSHINTSRTANKDHQTEDKDAAAQLVCLNDGEEIKQIVEIKDSLMYILSKYSYCAYRIYCLLPDKDAENKIRDEITKELKIFKIIS